MNFENEPSRFGLKNTQKYYPQDLTKIITGGIELILNNNSFEFDNKNYMQTQRTAMRTKLVPKYATLT